MIMQLLKNGNPVLTARSEHTINNSGHFLPVTYEGDLSIFPDPEHEISVDILDGLFSRIADAHGLTISGDYHHMINNIELAWDEKNEL